MYPPFQGNKPTGEFGEWCGGKDFDPSLMQMEANVAERKTTAMKKGFLSKLKGKDAKVKEEPKLDAGQLAEKAKALEEQLA